MEGRVVMDELNLVSVSSGIPDGNISMISLAPSDASQNLVLEELTAIHSMVGAKTKELAMKELEIIKYRKRLDLEITQSQTLLEELSDTLLAEAETTLRSRGESLKEKISEIADLTDKKLGTIKERAEEKKRIDLKIKTIEAAHRETKTKLSNIRASYELLKSENSNLKTEIESLKKSKKKLSLSLHQSEEPLIIPHIPPYPPQSSQSVQTDPPSIQLPPHLLVSTLSSALAATDPSSPDACAVLAARLILEVPDLPDGARVFCENSLFDRIILGLDVAPGCVGPSRLMDRARLDLLRKRMGVN